MISKFNGTCCYCGKPTRAGIDEYNTEKKKGCHRECIFAPPYAEAIATADRLLYCHHDDRSIQLMAGQWVTLRYLHESDRGETERMELGSTPHRNQNANLFDETAK